MNVEEYERMYTLEDTYWWFQGRMRMIQSILDAYMEREPRKGRVLDVGCGTGLMLSKLKRWQPIGLDFSHLAMKFCRKRGIRNLMIGDVVKLPVQSDSMDLILALDLIEHIERDDLMAREFHRVLRPGGYLMATVPAHQFLWSDHDIALHHHRRYSYKSFMRLLRGAGFKPVKYSFGITFTYIPIITFRRLQHLWQHAHGVDSPARPRAHLIPLPRFLNQPLIWLLHVEALLLRYVDLPFGISLMTLCQKGGK
jgi:SAM-dependent methyltransferase